MAGIPASGIRNLTGLGTCAFESWHGWHFTLARIFAFDCVQVCRINRRSPYRNDRLAPLRLLARGYTRRLPDGQRRATRAADGSR